MSIDSTIRQRVAGRDWKAAAAALAERGHATLPALLTPSECGETAALFERDDAFRKTVDMRAHAFGEGEYRYFARPLPALVEALRTQLYPPLCEIANAWADALGLEPLPPTLADFLAACHASGQDRPTPLLLRYRAGGYNRMHQDLYGELAFPLQVTCLLSDPGTDFGGGEFLLSEHRPRMQVRAEAIALERGEAIVFPNALRPGAGARGPVRVGVRHGVSRVRRGERLALGIIFHDAK